MAGKIRYRITTNPKLEKIAQAFRIPRQKKIDQWVSKLNDVVHRNIVNEAPQRTGDLRRAIVKRKVGAMQYEVTVDRRRKGGKYEAAVRLGVPASKINPILPRKKKALWWPGLPHPVMSVTRHPGIKANDYWTRGINKSQGDIKAAERVIMDDITREIINV